MKIERFPYLQRQLRSSQTKITRLLKQLSENKQILSARDDIAGTSVLNNVKSQLKSLKAANEKNISQGTSLLDVAYDGVAQIEEKRKELLALAVEAKDPLLAPAKRDELVAAFNQGVEDLNQIAESLSYNGKTLLDGTLKISLQTGANAGDTLSIKLTSLRASSLGIDSLSLSSAEAATKSEIMLEAAGSRISHVFSQINSLFKSLDFRQSSNELQIENLEEARSNLEDLDVVAATVELSAQQDLYKGQTSLLSSSLGTQSSLFDLLWRRSQ